MFLSLSAVNKIQTDIVLGKLTCQETVMSGVHQSIYFFLKVTIVHLFAMQEQQVGFYSTLNAAFIVKLWRDIYHN